MSPYTFVPIPVAKERAISEMATVGHELYLLSRGIKVSTHSKRCIGSEIVKLTSMLAGAQLSSYTTYNAIIFHLQLWMSISATSKTLQLQVSNFTLAENDGNSETFVTFNLPPHGTGQPSNVSQNFLLKCPQKLVVRGMYGIYFNPQVSSTATTVRVQPAAQFYNSSVLNQEEAIINIPFTAPTATQLPSSILLEVYDMQLDPTEDSQTEFIPTTTSKKIGGAIIKVKLPDTFTTKDGNPVQRTTCIESDSVLLHLQLNYTEKSSSEKDTLELRISKLNLTDSEGVFVPSANLSVQPYS